MLLTRMHLYVLDAAISQAGLPGVAPVEQTPVAMLRQQEMTLSDVALACGFADQSHFTRVFTPMTGISPVAWRPGLEQGEV
jgi:hypothetical protein